MRRHAILSLILIIALVTIFARPVIVQAVMEMNEAVREETPGDQADLAATLQAMQAAAARLERTTGARENFSRLARKIQETRTLPVIIRLRLSYRAEVEVAGGVGSEAQRRLIRQVRERLLDQLAGYEPTSVKVYDYLPLVALQLNVTGMDSVQGLIDALDIAEDELMSPELEQSTIRTGAAQSWAEGYTGAGQTIAIIDTGIDKNHPFLANKIVSEACYSTTDPNRGATSLCPRGVSSTVAADSALPCSGLSGCAHGTHVAGIAAGKGAAFSGVARDSTIISIQVFSRFSGPDACGPTVPTCLKSFLSDQLLALNRVFELKDTYAIAAINLSIGGGKYNAYCDQQLYPGKEAIDLLRSAGIATVVAAGNDGYTDGLAAPACISTAISVGSTNTSTDMVSSFSNTASFLNLLAPGSLINSSVPGSGFAAYQGTSMAAPHVAGAWAVLRQRAPQATINEIYSALTLSGVPITDQRVGITKSRIQIDAALRLIQPPVPPLPPPGNLVAALRAPTQVELSWIDNATTENGYRVRRRQVEADNWTVIATLGSGSNIFVDNDVVPGRRYYYTVVAFDGRGDSAPSNQTSMAIPDVVPAMPSNLRAVAASNTRIDLSWTRNSVNEAGFRIFRRVTTGSWQQVATTGNGVTSLMDGGLARATTYFYRVTAFNGVGESAPSSEATATTPIGERSFIVVTGNGAGSFDFGRIPIGRDLKPEGPAESFSIENPGASPIELILRIERQSDADGAARIVNPDDSHFFPVEVWGPNGEVNQLQFVDGRSVIRLAGGQRVNCRISFRPTIPAPAGRIGNLAAGHILAPEMRSRLIFDDGVGPLHSLALRGQIETKAMLINPFATRLSPLVVLARKGELLEAELTLFDPNLDAYQILYQFYDRSGKTIGPAVTLPIAQALQTSGMARGQSFTLVYRFTVRERLNDINAVRVIVQDREGTDMVTSGDIDQGPGRVINVSAASYARSGVSRGSISSAFGQGLAAAVQSAGGGKLPTILSGTRVIVRDSANIEREAPLFFVAPGQINYQIPVGTVTGTAGVSVIRDERVVAVGTVEIEPTAPGIFTADSSGHGLAAAQVLTVREDGAQLYRPVAEFDPATNSFTAQPIDLRRLDEKVYLVLFGTGIRERSELSRVRVSIAGISLPVLYAGPQPQYAGVDQVNLLLPRSLAGRGEVDLEIVVDDRRSNTVRIDLR